MAKTPLFHIYEKRAPGEETRIKRYPVMTLLALLSLLLSGGLAARLGAWVDQAMMRVYDALDLQANGPITFAGHVITTTALGSKYVYTVDVDGDGDLDVLSSHFKNDNGNGRTAWHENTSGDGSAWTDHVIHSASDASVCAADLDSDGDMDLLSTSLDGGQVAWYENNGALPPTFATRVISTRIAGPYSVHATDLDGDGDVDVLSAAYGEDEIAWHENDGRRPPHFTAHSIADDVEGAASVYAADVDGDGDGDVLSASFEDDTIAWYENDGRSPPTFTAHVITTDADNTYWTHAADVDGDGDVDVLSASFEDDTIAWYENDGRSPPTFAAHLITTDAEGALSVYTADLDGDGDVDVLASYRYAHDSGITAWYENDGGSPPTFTAHIITTHAHGSKNVRAADIDGDGDLDVLSGFVGDRIAWWEQEAVRNSAPTVTADRSSIVVDEGGKATNGGRVGDSNGDPVVLSASVGTVTDNGDGTWSWSFVTAEGPGESQMVAIAAQDERGDTSEVTFQLTVNNVAPVVDIGSEVKIEKGNTHMGAGSFADAGADAWQATVDYGDGSGVQPLTLNSDKTLDLEHTYEDAGIYTVQVCIGDDDGDIGCDSLAVTVAHTSPTVRFANTSTMLNEGGSAILAFSYQAGLSLTDWAAGLLYSYDCTDDGTFELVDAPEGWYHGCEYLDDGAFAARGRIVDKDGGYTEHTTQVRVSNVAPTASFASTSGTIHEGESVTLAFSNPFDPSSVDTAAGFLYSYDCTNDGTFELSDATLVSYACAYPDDGTFTARGRIQDKDGGFSEYTAQVRVGNVAPTASFTNTSGIIGEGDSATLAFSDAFDPGAGDATAGFLYAYDCTNDGTFELSDTVVTSYACAYPDDGAPTARGRIVDKDGDYTEYTVEVRVDSIAPTASFANLSETISEGQSATLVFKDPFDASSADAAAGLLYSYDCTNDGTFELSGATMASYTCEYSDDGTFAARGRIVDKDGGFSEYTAQVRVDNVAPTASFVHISETLNEGESATLAFSDPFDPSSADAAAGFLYAYDCANDGTFELSDATLASYACAYPDDGTFTAWGRIVDKDGGFSEYTAQVVVSNLAPTVGAITASLEPIRVGTEIAVSAHFTDPGLLDIHTAEWNWGDGTSPGSVDEANGSSSVSGSHSYASPGVYTVRLAVADRDGGIGESILQYVIVYDPEGGSVTGDGWFLSPGGAYIADPSLTDKASFSFVSQYEVSSTVPTGQMGFQLEVGDLDFCAETYDWLVVAGSKAQFQGTGTLNGRGNYGFALTAIDAQLTHHTDVDLFWIQIWDQAYRDLVVYDSQLGDAKDADPTTVIGSGDIAIRSQ